MLPGLIIQQKNDEEFAGAIRVSTFPVSFTSRETTLVAFVAWQIPRKEFCSWAFGNRPEKSDSNFSVTCCIKIIIGCTNERAQIAVNAATCRLYYISLVDSFPTAGSQKSGSIIVLMRSVCRLGH